MLKQLRLPFIHSLVVVSALLSSLSAAEEPTQNDASVNTALAEKLVEMSGGGTKKGHSWTLKRHWVGELKEVVTTGGYQEGEFLASDNKTTPVRLNVFDESLGFGGSKERYAALIAMGNRGFSTFAMHRETLPTNTDMRDSEKVDAILADFGNQHGFTDGWGLGEVMHWTEGWSWFTIVDKDQIRMLRFFAHVSKKKEKPKQIDHLLVREGFLRLSDPSDAGELKRFPLASTEEDERQNEIDAKDALHPEPLRSLLKASHTPGDSELKAYFAAIRQFREQPNAELLNQLVANLDERTCEFDGIADCLFGSEVFEDKIGKWNPDKLREACKLLIEALPHANSRESMQDAVEIVLRESGIEKLRFRAEGININMESRYTETGRSSSYTRFDISSDKIRESGEIIRDELLRLMK
ncbi:hypothetical protein Q31b_38050 [Novipirellula aureliae]|uniref:Secreted protein n=1 Tax=Novipirellula aureliae TaxID=2527966 RepID=A0A5C6DS64_9BACT|nr:hypothetical protein [Novipirellula aureliae]TWU38727.1 hypothetical protein Q31b_38050 [Novipirellula aureliae]